MDRPVPVGLIGLDSACFQQLVHASVERQRAFQPFDTLVEGSPTEPPVKG